MDVAAVAAALGFVFAPALVRSQPASPPPALTASAGGSPVTINRCGPLLDNGSTQSVAGIPIASKSTGIRIEFTNESAKTADLINFAITSNGERFVIRDVGTFSSGVSIDHKYRNGSGQAFVLPAFIAPNVACEVSSVRFVDGSAWRKGEGLEPAAPAPGTSAASLSATPSRLEIDRSTESELFMVSSSDRVGAFRETDDCAKVATVFVAATGQRSATYSVRPLAAGTCTAHIVDESGRSLDFPILVR